MAAPKKAQISLLQSISSWLVDTSSSAAPQEVRDRTVIYIISQGMVAAKGGKEAPHSCHGTGSNSFIQNLIAVW